MNLHSFNFSTSFYVIWHSHSNQKYASIYDHLCNVSVDFFSDWEEQIFEAFFGPVQP
jgi:hypothetical protein